VITQKKVIKWLIDSLLVQMLVLVMFCELGYRLKPVPQVGHCISFGN